MLSPHGQFADLWSGADDLPPYRTPDTTEPIQTSTIIPLRHANRRVFGVLNFETKERLEITPAAKDELLKVAEAVSIAYRLFRDTQNRNHRTVEALDCLDDELQKPLQKLTKPRIFFASSARANEDVVNLIKETIESEFPDILKLVHWNDMAVPGILTSNCWKS